MCVATGESISFLSLARIHVNLKEELPSMDAVTLQYVAVLFRSSNVGILKRSHRPVDNSNGFSLFESAPHVPTTFIGILPTRCVFPHIFKVETRCGTSPWYLQPPLTAPMPSMLPISSQECDQWRAMELTPCTPRLDMPSSRSIHLGVFLNLRNMGHQKDGLSGLTIDIPKPPLKTIQAHWTWDP